MVDQAEIHRKVVSGDVEEREWAAGQLSDNFADLPDKELAWKDMIRLTQDDWRIRLGVGGALDPAFQHVPNKKQAWRDLIRLTDSEASYVMYSCVQHMRLVLRFSMSRTEKGHGETCID